ncbi:4Fe-4S cluster-binding domain-containing protein, partial [bacterium]|nr:4Fe-4S cluster-binding domain-containing protein [bacterium]
MLSKHISGGIERTSDVIDLATTALTHLRLGPITLVDLFVTRRCNFACKYCFIEGKDALDTNTEVLRATVKFLLKAMGNENEATILLFGGEPLLVFDTIVDFVPYARREFMRAGKKASFSITTNGSLITP